MGCGGRTPPSIKALREQAVGVVAKKKKKKTEKKKKMDEFWQFLNFIRFVLYRLFSVGSDMIYGMPLPPTLIEEGEE